MILRSEFPLKIEETDAMTAHPTFWLCQDHGVARPVSVLAGFGVVLGALGALGWHWQPGFIARWPPAWINLPPHPSAPLYSGVIPLDAISDWARPWWPVMVVLPMAGAGLGAGLGALMSMRTRRVWTAAVFVGLLGLLVGVVSAVAWHCIPGAYSGWLGGFIGEVDLGYPITGLVLGVLGAGTAAVSGVLAQLSQLDSA